MFRFLKAGVVKSEQRKIQMTFHNSFIPSYRTYRRPRYKVAYKMVTEMEWKCCHGYSGEDCHDRQQVTTDTKVDGGQPRVTQTGYITGGGQRGGGRDGKKTMKFKLHV